MDSEHKTRGERTADCDPPVDSYPADLGLRQCTEATADLSARTLLQKLLVSLTGGVGISSSALGDITVEQCGWDVTVTFGTVNGCIPALPVAVTNVTRPLYQMCC